MTRRPFLGIDDPPHVSRDDIRALAWLLAIGFVVLALCSVPPEWLAVKP